MATQKCVHKGCGKQFSDPTEPCTYHPGPPIFHEGQKGWKCCKPRVLTFDEFLTIPPCTTGIHSSIDDTPEEYKPKPVPQEDIPLPAPPRVATETRTPRQAAPVAVKEPEPETSEDDEAIPVPDKATCRRRTCGAVYSGAAAGTAPGASSGAAPGASSGTRDRSKEECVFHPGVPIFHEGTKGWTCCKKRVLEFDEFMGMMGCTTKSGHLFVGRGKKSGDGGEKGVESVRHDFYQTPSTIHASFFLKKIDRESAHVALKEGEIEIDVRTLNNERWKTVVPLYSGINAAQSSFKILGTKLEVELVKSMPGEGWPVLRGDEKTTGEIIQTGRAGQFV